MRVFLDSLEVSCGLDLAVSVTRSGWVVPADVVDSFGAAVDSVGAADSVDVTADSFFHW